MAVRPTGESAGSPSGTPVPSWLVGLHWAMLAALSLIPLVMLVSGIATGYWPVAAAAVPAFVFFFAATQAFLANTRARQRLLADRTLQGAQPAYRGSAMWAGIALVALVVTVLVMKIPA